MKRKHKRKPIARRRFIISWTLAWYLSLFLPSLLAAPALHLDFIDYPPTIILDITTVGLLALLQIVLARRCLHTELRHWLFLALLGFIVGQIGLHFLQANVDYPFPPWVIQRLKEPESIAFLRYALYTITRNFFYWCMPLVFQWLALRRRFRHHGLWLMAAVMSAPLSFILFEHGGILAHAIDLLEHLTGFSLAYSLNLLVLLLDWVTPAIIMGLVLQYIVMKKDAPQREAKSAC